MSWVFWVFLAMCHLKQPWGIHGSPFPVLQILSHQILGSPRQNLIVQLCFLHPWNFELFPWRKSHWGQGTILNEERLGRRVRSQRQRKASVRKNLWRFWNGQKVPRVSCPWVLGTIWWNFCNHQILEGLCFRRLRLGYLQLCKLLELTVMKICLDRNFVLKTIYTSWKRVPNNITLKKKTKDTNQFYIHQ